jgi:hypothetical protein
MKFRLFTLLILLVFSLDVASAQDAKKAENNGVVFDKTAVDFGDVLRENKNYTCTFIVENKTDKPLVLLSVKTSCSCLKPQYSRRPLKVGEKSSIRMTLEAAKMEQGVFHRVVEVHTNAGVARVVVRGNVVLPND